MKIEIDTEKDSEEQIKHAIGMLKNLVSDKSAFDNTADKTIDNDFTNLVNEMGEQKQEEEPEEEFNADFSFLNNLDEPQDETAPVKNVEPVQQESIEPIERQESAQSIVESRSAAESNQSVNDPIAEPAQSTAEKEEEKKEEFDFSKLMEY